ncbi:hypothetical protein NEMBOFW57_010979 [Staphylotrichum longicolle]|uniref:Deoxyribose-phosphate aldolase n=1 Tax=Staphylotrichum longicolle TaxID=669026 RepID=A0AAD4ENZ9_9PEZI|nr:hypothetical protein NEMBOFW57_010979 [Staphylotrichum longicolle]
MSSSPSSTTSTITVSLPQLAKLIDHALLQPNLTDAEIETGLALAKNYKVATACIKPYSIPSAKAALAGTGVLICAVFGFPHGNSTTEVKVFEATAAARAGADEIDMVAAALKVIFENDYLQDTQIARLCRICSDQPNGAYNYTGATIPHVKLMRETCAKEVQIKASGGIRSLDEVLYMMHLGVSRIGTSGTVGILEEARKRGIGEDPVQVPLVTPGGVEKLPIAY